VNVAYCVRACAHIPPTVDMAEVSKKRAVRGGEVVSAV
jgi:hypothetical protein